MTKHNDKLVVNIVITGGPCAGKSMSIPYVKSRLEKQGWTVLVVPETATELITGGVAPWTCKNNYEYHKLQLSLHDYMETIFRKAAENMESERIVILYDRGQPDAMAYISFEDFYSICLNHHLHSGQEIDRYDAVFHLETAAKNYSQYYILANNEARHESIEEAIDLDDKILHAYQFHTHRVIITGEEYFGTKLLNLCNSIEKFLDSVD